VLYGIAPVTHALEARRRPLRRVYVKQGDPSPRLLRILDLAGGAGVPVEPVDAHVLAVRAEGKNHQGTVLECGDLPTGDLRTWLARLGDAGALVLALDRIEDPQNLGGLIRSAAFLGADAVLLHRGKRSPLSAAASKASAGTMESFPILEEPNLARALESIEQAGFFAYGASLSPEAVDYRTQTPSARSVIVVGNEGDGLRALTAKRCDVLVRIPGTGSAESLNVNVAGGILLSHFRSGGGPG
jgi:23S rRNA (guanosine2251-2'-O)-methyltransferase